MSANLFMKFFAVLSLSLVMAVFGVFAPVSGIRVDEAKAAVAVADLDAAFPGLNLGLDPAFSGIDAFTLGRLLDADDLIVSLVLPVNVDFLTLREIVLLERILSLQGVPFNVTSVAGLVGPVVTVIDSSVIPGTEQLVALISVPAIVTVVPITGFGIFDFDEPDVSHVPPVFFPRQPVFIPRQPAFLPRPCVLRPDIAPVAPRLPIVPPEAAPVVPRAPVARPGIAPVAPRPPVAPPRAAPAVPRAPFARPNVAPAAPRVPFARPGIAAPAVPRAPLGARARAAAWSNR